MKPRSQHRRGFTLIELLIVCGIIGIIALAPYSLIARLDEQRQYLQERMEASAEAQAAIRVWRNDVEASVDIEVNESADVMTIHIAGRNGLEEVRYRVANTNVLERTHSAHGGITKVLAGNVSRLTFERQGDAWTIQWATHWTDGLREMTWPQQGWAAPLLGGVAGASSGEKAAP